ncbi:MAG: hypothetical protein OXE43_01305 [Chloroflexi bacterium]|nr:hypothetical protein [Chloroflexota bacterium]
MWVLDGGKERLFGSDPDSGEQVAEYELDGGNSASQGLSLGGTCRVEQAHLPVADVYRDSRAICKLHVRS